MEKTEAIYYSAASLSERGDKDIPKELVSATHLIYSSPATLAFNSPGAEGYGVKRAGLAVPDSVMLIVSPGCCGRNTSAISRMPGYEDRFFYLTMDQTDLVTGRHLKKIPGAVAEICRGLEIRGRKPRVVMICITCVDALLGTDMERICRRAEEEIEGVRVQPCYMYALTREGRKPPMVHVRQSIYELLEPRRKKPSSVNILGFFAPLEGSEFFSILRQAGVRKVRQIGACADYGDFMDMAEANFNIVLNPEARPAAYDLQDRLGIPFIEMGRFYQIDRIRAQYAALGRVLQTTFEDGVWEKEAAEAVESFRRRFPDAVFSIGEAMNGNPFELACALVREGFSVREIFGTVGKDSYVWIDLLARLSPETRIYSNLHPSMLHYDAAEAEGKRPAAGAGHAGGGAEKKEETRDGNYVTVSIGRDAGFYHPDLPNVQWNSDLQPFGYRAVTGLFRSLEKALESGTRGAHASTIMLKGLEPGACPFSEQGKEETSAQGGDPDPVSRQEADKRTDGLFAGKRPRGFRRFTTPFAPDQSGAVSVLYDMGGICVICDAGGCTGNICGFDEPRWFGAQSAVFSAGLRDMDAILGRDDRLVEKLADAAKGIKASFAAIVGTPVPAVIGTDYRALSRMAAKKTGLPVVGVDSNGMEYYDRGIEKTYLALLEAFCRPGQARGNALCRPGKAQENEQGGPGRMEENALCGPGKAQENALNGPGEMQETKMSEAEAGRRGRKKRIAGIWGFSPLDFGGILSEKSLLDRVRDQGFDGMICCGAGTGIQDLKEIGRAEKNFVLSPSGAPAAKWLEDRYGTPWDYWIPDLDPILSFLGKKDKTEQFAGHDWVTGKKILILHQQVLADALRRRLEGMADRVDTASFFMMNRDLLRPGDRSLREETDLRELVRDGEYDLVIGDRSLEPILEGLDVTLIHLPHFAVSGELLA